MRRSSGCMDWATTAMAGRRSSGRWVCREGRRCASSFPHAPVMPVTINNGMAMRAWYDFKEADFSARADLAGVRRSTAHIEALIAREVGARRDAAAHRAGRVLAGRGDGAVCGPAASRPAGRHRRAVDVPDRRSEPGHRGGAGQSRRSDLHGARHAGSRRAVRVGRDVAAGAGRRRLERRMAHLSDGPRRGARGSRRLRQVPGGGARPD